MANSDCLTGIRQQNNTEELISSYLDELFGKPVQGASELLSKAPKENENERVKQRAEILSTSINDGHWLIPTLKLFTSESSKKIRSREESMLILLNNLYFLRRPLPVKVRQCFLDSSEQMLEDYQSASWEEQVSHAGVLCES